MKRFFIALIILVLLLGMGLIWWNIGVAPVDKKSQEKKIFVIQKNEGIRSIAKRLKDERLIADPIVFFLFVVLEGLDAKIQAGDFRLSPSMNAKSIAIEFTHGTLDVWVTIPEGLRSEEIAQIFKDKVPSFDNTWVTQLKKNEGYLFPDTYLMPKDADIDFIIQVMRSNFDKKWKEVDSIDINSKMSPDEIVILASIVEREAKFAEDKPLVARVLVNRLKLGIPLQADATIQYAIGKVNNSWWKKGLTREDLKTNSLFNTYTHYGLPPSPISNPGLDTLRAATYPSKTNYLYYLSSSDGRMHYAQTLEQHNKNIEKYLQ